MTLFLLLMNMKHRKQELIVWCLLLGYVTVSNQNRLVIDAGTCVTYDFIDLDNNYLGGAILSQVTTEYEALHFKTTVNWRTHSILLGRQLISQFIRVSLMHWYMN
jgi:hypothetical protein